MSDDVARAVGSGWTEEIVIAGKKCTVRPLTIKELGEIERECLKRYRRSYLETYSENLDLLPESDRDHMIRDKLEETAKWDVGDLPTRRAYDTDKVKINDKVLAWLRENHPGFDETVTDEKRKKRLAQRVVSTALDSGTLSPETYQAMTGFVPASANVGYVNWWVTACFDGQLEMIYSCFRHNGVTRDEICAEIGKNPSVMVNISREIEHLTAPQAGNT